MRSLIHGLPQYLSVNQACEVAGFSRTTFYKILDDKSSGLATIVCRIPGSGRIRVPSERYARWIEGKLPKVIK